MSFGDNEKQSDKKNIGAKPPVEMLHKNLFPKQKQNPNKSYLDTSDICMLGSNTQSPTFPQEDVNIEDKNMPDTQILTSLLENEQIKKEENEINNE